MKAPLETVSLDTMIDNHIGKRGTQKRDVFERELKIEIKTTLPQNLNPKSKIRIPKSNKPS
ncbi:hypothetical protein [Mucilaginibacter sp.]|uniref:hypothetical protein n=1 Tax=Mucilaginibacter sp. TaxID=1882438 RepID=UPI00284DA651|nr:hypothetical protein [Mucilaginibacter sp.]MDR3694098.1 hypothetical protein [Mucilaginibacter sp.]